MSEEIARFNAATGERTQCCPFCGDDGYDLFGLKLHLVRGWCGHYNAIELLMPESWKPGFEAQP